MYSVGMRIPTGTGAFVGGSHSFGQLAVPEAPVDKLQLLELFAGLVSRWDAPTPFQTPPLA
jgi:hypothetical protein